MEYFQQQNLPKREVTKYLADIWQCYILYFYCHSFSCIRMQKYPLAIPFLHVSVVVLCNQTSVECSKDTLLKKQVPFIFFDS